MIASVLPFISGYNIFFTDQIVFGELHIVDIYFQCSYLVVEFTVFFTFSVNEQIKLFDSLQSEMNKNMQYVEKRKSGRGALFTLLIWNFYHLFRWNLDFVAFLLFHRSESSFSRLAISANVSLSDAVKEKQISLYAFMCIGHRGPEHLKTYRTFFNTFQMYS